MPTFPATMFIAWSPMRVRTGQPTRKEIHVCYGSKPRWGLRATIWKAATAATLWISWSWTVKGVVTETFSL
jgi:hypothetical protein